MRRSIAILALLVACPHGPSRADQVVMLDDGLGNSVTLNATTNSTAHTGSGAIDSFSFTPAGLITVDATLGTWDVNVTTGQSKPLLGSAANPVMDLNTVNDTTAAGNLTVRLTDTSFGPAGPGSSFRMNIGGTLDSGLALISTLNSDPGNLAFGTGGVSTSLASIPLEFSGTSTTPAIPAPYTAYSLTLTDVIHANNAGVASFDHELTGAIVAEPSAMLLLALGMLAMIGCIVRR